jgi:hypothetical protein
VVLVSVTLVSVLVTVVDVLEAVVLVCVQEVEVTVVVPHMLSSASLINCLRASNAFVMSPSAVLVASKTVWVQPEEFFDPTTHSGVPSPANVKS